MNIDIRLSTDFFLHPKTKLLQKQLGPKGVLCLQKLWIWAAQNRPNGVLGVQSYDYIAMAADWTGKSQLFVDTLLELHWLDCDESGSYSLHNWESRQPYAKDANERRARAQKQSQEKAAEISDKRRDAAKRRWDKQRAQNSDNLPPANNPSDLECKPDANDMQMQCKSSMQMDANENLLDANAMQKNANGCYHNHNHNQIQNLDLTPLISPQGGTPGADAPTGVSAQVQEAKHEAQEQPAPSPQPEPTAATQQPEQPTLSPEQPAKPKRKRTDYRRKDFDEWFGEYPNQTSEDDAWKEWQRKIKQGKLPEQPVLMDALQEHKRSRRWLEGYVKDPDNYLRGEHWKDKLPMPAQPQQQFFSGQQPQGQYGTPYQTPYKPGSIEDTMAYNMQVANRVHMNRTGQKLFELPDENAMDAQIINTETQGLPQFGG